MERPIDLSERRAEKIAKTKETISQKVSAFFATKEITGVTLTWDDVDDYRTIRFSLQAAHEGEQLLNGSEFHRSLLTALAPTQFAEPTDYELNPYGEIGFITFHKR